MFDDSLTYLTLFPKENRQLVKEKKRQTFLIFFSQPILMRIYGNTQFFVIVQRLKLPKTTSVYLIFLIYAHVYSYLDRNICLCTYIHSQ